MAQGTHRQPRPSHADNLAEVLDDAADGVRRGEMEGSEDNVRSRGRENPAPAPQQRHEDGLHTERTEMSSAAEETPRVGSSAYATSEPASSVPTSARDPVSARVGGTGHGMLSSERRDQGSSGRYDDRPRTSPERPENVPPVPIAEMKSRSKPPLGPSSGSRTNDKEREAGEKPRHRARSSSRDRDRDRGDSRPNSRANSRDRKERRRGKENRESRESHREDQSRRSTRRGAGRRAHPDDYDSDDLSPASDSEDEDHRRARRRGQRAADSRRSTHRSRRASDTESLSDGFSVDGRNDGGNTNRIYGSFDGKTEYKVLAQEMVGYGHAMDGSDGKKHRQEDLPIRLAFEHLSSLSGMSQKVQDAINQSSNLFKRKVDRLEQGMLRKAWRGWLLVQLGFVKKKNILKRAINKMRRRKLYLTFQRWSEVYTKKKKGGTLYRSVLTVVRRGRMRRTFHAWREKRADTRRRLLMVEQARRLKDDFQTALVKRGLRQVMHKRIRAAWNAFDRFSAARRAKRNKMRKVIGRAMHGQQSRAFQRWTKWNAIMRKQRAQLKRAVMRMLRAKLARGFAKWKGVMEAKKEKERKMRRVLMKVLKGQQARAFAKWWENVVQLKTYERKVGNALLRMQKRRIFKAFDGWAAKTELMKYRKELAMKILGRIMHRVKAKAWAQWMKERELSMGCTAEQVRQLRDENARLRRDNERFVRLVDSGEWGRGRVEELTEAGRVLREERRQLEDLIRSIKLEKDGIVKDRQMAAKEERALKDRLVSGNFIQRNKLTVRGGSAFHSLQRALKQDLLDSGAAARNPEALQALYEVDKLALDRVTVFPDGELNIQAVATDVEPFTRSAIGTRPIARGAAHDHDHGYPGAVYGRREERAERRNPSPRPRGYPGSSSGSEGRGGAGEGRGERSGEQQMFLDMLANLDPEEVDLLEEVQRRARLQSATTGGRGGVAGGGRSARDRPHSAY